MVHIEIPPESARKLNEEAHKPAYIQKLGAETAEKLNEELNVGPVARFFKNKAVKYSLVGMGAALAGAAGGIGYLMMGGPIPNLSSVGTGLGELGSTLASAPGRLWNAIPGETNVTKGLVAGLGGLAVGGGVVYPVVRAAFAGGQSTRNIYRHNQEHFHRTQDELSHGAHVVFENGRQQLPENG